MASWRPGTRKQYASAIKKWTEFCYKEQISVYTPNVVNVLEFLQELFADEKSYSNINTARSALSTFINIDSTPVGSHSLITRFMKGVFSLRPPRPRYNETWDVEIMLTYLRKLSPVKRLSLKELTMKLVMLLLLTTAQRKQTLLLLDTTKLHMTRSSCVFQLTGLVKTSRTGDTKGTLVVKGYAPDRRLCIMFALHEYITRTKALRKEESQLFISYQRPCKAITTQTLSRWISTTMEKAGINTKVFKPHSTRSAAVSKADVRNVPIRDILQKAGWSNTGTFAKYYKKKIIKDTFQDAVLGKKKD